jgi:Methylamine utilisation protein MauE
MATATISAIVSYILAAVFIFAGTRKAMGFPLFHVALARLGVTKAASHVLGALLPICEVVIGVLLITSVTRLAGAVAACFMLIAFSEVLAINLAAANRPRCNCFGSVSERGITWFTVLRNAALLASAFFVLWSQLTRQADVKQGDVIVRLQFVLAVAIASTGVAALAMWPLIRAIVRVGGHTGADDSGLAPPRKSCGRSQSGHAARETFGGWTTQNRLALVDWPIKTHAGNSLDIPSFLKGQPGMMLALHSECAACQGILRVRLTGWQAAASERIRILPVVFGSDSCDDERVYRVRGFSLEDLGVEATPAAIPVDQTGLVCGEIVYGSDVIGTHLEWYLAGVAAE